MEQYRVVDTPYGPLTYVLVKKRIKNLNLRLDRRGVATVSIPLACPEERADAWVREKSGWIFAHQPAAGPHLLTEVDRTTCLALLEEFGHTGQETSLRLNRANLENLTAQMEEAKIEVQRSFPQEQELAEKSDRLNVLRIALNMDGKTVGKRQREAEELESDTQGGQPSIKGMLKRLGVESAATASPPAKGKDMEVAI